MNSGTCLQALQRRVREAWLKKGQACMDGNVDWLWVVCADDINEKIQGQLDIAEGED